MRVPTNNSKSWRIASNPLDDMVGFVAGVALALAGGKRFENEEEMGGEEAM